MATTAGITIVSYKAYAQQKGWPIGKVFESSTWLNIIALLAILGGAVELFFNIKWYWAILGVIGAWLASGAITAVFAKHTQILSILLLIASVLVWIIGGVQIV
jgi:hypothetical protein